MPSAPILSLAAILLATTAASAESPGFRVPPDFEVTLHAGDALAHDVFSMTVDARGRVVVAGRNYIKILEDTDRDGRADRALLFSRMPKSGAHGLYFDGNDLLCVGDNGVWRLRDEDGDGVADGEPELWLPNASHSEHAANGIIRGPDGWYYLACGNDAGITASHAKLPGSPVKDPNAGAIVRISPDGKTSEVLADGFRNPYDLDFNSLGNLFTYDADGERDHHLPWYTPTRIFDIAPGRHHGWTLKGWQHAWNRPASHFDTVERLFEVGRGSPTGVLVYRHTLFPERYRDGLFAVCWTYGRIYFFPMTRRDSTYSAHMEIFMETMGDTGFAPVDIAVGIDGDLFVAIGGRGTMGSVFRVSYKGPPSDAPAPSQGLAGILNAPQPLSSWSRADWVPRAKRAGQDAFGKAAMNPRLRRAERIRAMEILVELFGGIAPHLARSISQSDDPELTARAVWAVSRSPDSEASREFLAEMTFHKDARVLRAAWEALMTLPSPLRNAHPDWRRGLSHSDGRIRAAAVVVAQGAGREIFPAGRLGQTKTPKEKLGLLMALAPGLLESESGIEEFFRGCVGVFEQGDANIRLDAVRLLQIGLGDCRVIQDKPTIHDGFIAHAAERIPLDLRRWTGGRLAGFFPAAGEDLNRELARLFAMLDAASPDVAGKLSLLWTEQSSVEDDIHFLAALSRLPSAHPADVTERTARALPRLHKKMAAQEKEPSRTWPARVGEVFEILQQQNPTLARTLIAQPDFELAGHALFARLMPGVEKVEAARKLLRLARERDAGGRRGFTAELVELISALPEDESLAALREQWRHPGLRDAVVVALARRPHPEDRERFVEALRSFQAPVVERAANALRQFGPEAQPAEMALALEALRRFASTRERGVCEALARVLERWTGRDFRGEPSDFAAAQAGWLEWFQENHPDVARSLEKDHIAWPAWKERLQTIDWNAGEVRRGEGIFEERACHRCHGTVRRLGPDLTGVTARFSRDDLFQAIVDPNRDVSPAYYPQVMTTRSGETYTGTVVYGSPTVTLLQTGPDTTVRLSGDDIASVHTSNVSTMPSELLAGLSDTDLADLYAYLRTLRK